MTTIATATNSPKRRPVPRTVEEYLRQCQETEPEAIAERDIDYLMANAPQQVLLSAAVHWARMKFNEVVNPKAPLAPDAIEARRAARERGKAVAEREATMAQQTVVATFGAAFVMPDGRALGAWTIGELRRLNSGFAFILAKAGDGDDARTVGDVMDAKAWRRAAKLA